MSDTLEVSNGPTRLGRVAPLLIGATFSIIGGSAGYWVTTNSQQLSTSAEQTENMSIPVDLQYLEIEPFIINLKPLSLNKYLKVSAQIELKKNQIEDVKNKLPRIIATINGYLNSLTSNDLTDSGSIARVRRQIMHRINLTTHPIQIADVLITEFIIK